MRIVRHTSDRFRNRSRCQLIIESCSASARRTPVASLASWFQRYWSTPSATMTKAAVTMAATVPKRGLNWGLITLASSRPELVTDPLDREEESRLPGIVFQFLAPAGH